MLLHTINYLYSEISVSDFFISDVFNVLRVSFFWWPFRKPDCVGVLDRTRLVVEVTSCRSLRKNLSVSACPVTSVITGLVGVAEKVVTAQLAMTTRRGSRRD